jgi:hypothetical protein
MYRWTVTRRVSHLRAAAAPKIPPTVDYHRFFTPNAAKSAAASNNRIRIQAAVQVGAGVRVQFRGRLWMNQISQQAAAVELRQRLEIRLHRGLDATCPRELDQLWPVPPLALPIKVDRFPDGIHADLVPVFEAISQCLLGAVDADRGLVDRAAMLSIPPKTWVTPPSYWV